MRPLQVVVISDGRPGHEKQSRAILEELLSLTEVKSIYLAAPELTWKACLRYAMVLTAGIGASSNIPPAGPADLVLGAGTRTHLPMLAYKRQCSARLVVCMSPERWLRPWFDLCLVPRHDQLAERSNLFATFGPPCLQATPGNRDPQKGLILVGGRDPKSHYWDGQKLMEQIKTLVAGDANLKWVISSSPRTPLETEALLDQFAQGTPATRFISSQATPRGWIEAAYAKSAHVWVTADSVSMVYEALTAGCRVGILPVCWKKTPNKFQYGIDDLKAQGWIVDFDQWQRGRMLQAPVEPLNEARRCATEVLKRWWPERLG